MVPTVSPVLPPFFFSRAWCAVAARKACASIARAMCRPAVGDLGRAAAFAVLRLFRSSSNPGGCPPCDPLRRRAARLSIFSGIVCRMPVAAGIRGRGRCCSPCRPRAVRRPQPVALVNGLPRPEPLRRIAPLHPGPNPVKNPVDHLPMITPSPAPTIAHRQERPQPLPLSVRQLTTLSPPHARYNEQIRRQSPDRPDSSLGSVFERGRGGSAPCVTHRHELSDAEWAVLPRFLPSAGAAGSGRPGGAGPSEKARHPISDLRHWRYCQFQS